MFHILDETYAHLIWKKPTQRTRQRALQLYYTVFRTELQENKYNGKQIAFIFTEC